MIPQLNFFILLSFGRVSRKEIILCIKRQSVTGVIIPNVPLLPNTPMGRGMQMIDVTGVMVLTHILLFD